MCKCKKCNNSKTLAEMATVGQCKKCYNDYHNGWQKNNKDKTRRYITNYRLKKNFEKLQKEYDEDKIKMKILDNKLDELFLNHIIYGLERYENYK